MITQDIKCKVIASGQPKRVTPEELISSIVADLTKQTDFVDKSILKMNHKKK